MQRKWFVLFATLVLFSLLIAPLGPAGAQGPLPPPSPEKLSPEIEQARARQSMEAVLAKYLAYWGPRYQLSLGEVTVEGEWAHGVTEGQSGAKMLSGPIHILAHRSSDGTWQALLPGTDGTYIQWLDAVPERLVPAGEKTQLRTQATEADALRQPQATPAVPLVLPGEVGPNGPGEPIPGSTQPMVTPTPVATEMSTVLETATLTPPDSSGVVDYLIPESGLLPADAKNAIALALTKWQYESPQNGRFSILSVRLELNWGLATLTSADLISPPIPGQETSVFNGRVASLVLVHDNNEWKAAVEGDKNVNMLLDLIPENELSSEAKNALFFLKPAIQLIKHIITISFLGHQEGRGITTVVGMGLQIKLWILML